MRAKAGAWNEYTRNPKSEIRNPPWPLLLLLPLLDKVNVMPAPGTTHPKSDIRHPKSSVASRRSVIASAFGAAGLAAQERVGKDAPISPKDNLKVTRLEMILVKPRWLFLKVHTNAGIVGYGEP